MIVKRTKKFWAGFVDGKIDIHCHGVAIFDKKNEAKSMYEDVRKVSVTYEAKV